MLLPVTIPCRQILSVSEYLAIPVNQHMAMGLEGTKGPMEMGPDDIKAIQALLEGLSHPGRNLTDPFSPELIPPPAEWLAKMFRDRMHSKGKAEGFYNKIYKIKKDDDAPGSHVALRVGRKKLRNIGELRHMLKEVIMAIQTANACPAPAVFGYTVIDGWPVTAHELFERDLITAFQRAIQTSSTEAMSRNLDVLARGVTEAIQCMGKNNLVHTDIKGGNMVTRDRPFKVALIDFDPHFVVKIPPTTDVQKKSYILWMMLQIELVEMAGHISISGVEPREGYIASLDKYVPRLFVGDGSPHTLQPRFKGADLPGLWFGTTGTNPPGTVKLEDFWTHIHDLDEIPKVMAHYLVIKPFDYWTRVENITMYRKWLYWLSQPLSMESTARWSGPSPSRALDIAWI